MENARNGSAFLQELYISTAKAYQTGKHIIDRTPYELRIAFSSAQGNKGATYGNIGSNVIIYSPCFPSFSEREHISAIT